MDHGMASSMGGGAPAPKKRYTAMTFFWGKDSEILFTGWPGTRGGMYALALIVVFVLALLLEWLSYCRLTRPGWSRGAAGLVRTIAYTLRVGLAYLMMLALMSFNGGVFIVAVAGHAAGFLLFGSWRKADEQHGCGGGGDLPTMKC